MGGGDHGDNALLSRRSLNARTFRDHYKQQKKLDEKNTENVLSVLTPYFSGMTPALVSAGLMSRKACASRRVRPLLELHGLPPVVDSMRDTSMM